MKSTAVFLFSLVVGTACYAQTNLWQNTGNIGIGTTNPGAKLEVNGGSIAVKSPTSTYGSVALNPGGAGYAGYIDWYRDGQSRLAYLGYQDFGGSQNNLGLNLENGANFIIGGGNVSIGKVSPAYPLVVYRSSLVSTRGVDIQTDFTGSATKAAAGGVFGWVNIYDDGPVTTVTPVQGTAVTWGSGAISTAFGGRFVVANGGYLSAGTSVLANAYGVYSQIDSRGTTGASITNAYLFYGGPMVRNFPITNSWGVYIADIVAKNYFAGSVGIGTTSPGSNSKLEVNGSLVLSGDAGGASPDPGDGSGPALRLGYRSLSQGAVEYGFIQAMHTGVAPKNLALQQNGGNVGIGTVSPTEKLSVKGKIRAQEVIVETTGWSDHVFADSYQLQPLSEVEQHIKTEKHLPGVPSAQEVAEKGVSVGDMQAILLAKIEELTLHQIAQEKRLNEATAKIEHQAAEILRLTTQVK